MQQINLTKSVHDQLIRHGVSHTPSASLWVVDSKPLEPGKYSVAMVHIGCDSCSSWLPAVGK